MGAIFAGLLGIGILALGLALFLVLALSCELGFRLARLRWTHAAPDDHEFAVTGTLTSAMAALLAFILGLSVNYAQGRYEARRDLVVGEANAIGTAWRRAQAFGGPDGAAIASLTGEYAQTQVAFVSASASEPVEAIHARAQDVEARIWRVVAASAGKDPNPMKAALVIALNEMFDEAQALRFALIGESPGLMLDMMVAGSMIAIGALGFEMGLRGHRQVVLTALLLIMWSGAMVIVAELNRPRMGLVRVDPTPLVWTLHDIRSENAPSHP
jgi:hypothetical protein